ncbi:MAG: YwiC-like family protein [Actinomycetota bacterium]
MSDSTGEATESHASRSGPVASWRQVAIPSEHGGWSLTAEPVLLGLIVAWSWSGLALGVAAMLAFVARTPLKVVLVDRWRQRLLPRTRLAARTAAAEIAAIAGLGAVAAIGSASGWFWVPLALAGPLVGLELWYDMRSRSRRLLPELAGTVGIGSVVAAIALAGGESATLAGGLWTVVAGRGIASIVYARTQIFRLHDRPVARWPSDAAQIVSVAGVTVAWAVSAIPVAPVVALGCTALFHVAALRRPVHRALVVGLQQLVVGVAIVVVTAIAILVT